MLTDTQLKSLKPRDRVYKAADALGLYVMVSPAGGKSFRYDYRINGRRETLTIGRYEEGTPSRTEEELKTLDFGAVLSLADARALLSRAKRMVEQGESPSRAKVEKRTQASEALTFGRWAERYFEFKSDPKSGDEKLAESTLGLRQSIYKRILAEPLGKLKLEEITPRMLRDLCALVKEKRGPAPAVQARELVLLVFRHATANGEKVANPADEVAPKSIATFAARDRSLSPAEIRTFFNALEKAPAAPPLRLAVKFVLLTLVRKGEFIGATWPEVDFVEETWTIPKSRMKPDAQHWVVPWRLPRTEAPLDHVPDRQPRRRDHQQGSVAAVGGRLR